MLLLCSIAVRCPTDPQPGAAERSKKCGGGGGGGGRRLGVGMNGGGRGVFDK